MTCWQESGGYTGLREQGLGPRTTGGGVQIESSEQQDKAPKKQEEERESKLWKTWEDQRPKGEGSWQPQGELRGGKK